ncbi:MAG: hypothetical protein KC609_23880 [Myxococcales bacterium]|nr:hypothetical protein [Myxococcales bacterium]
MANDSMSRRVRLPFYRRSDLLGTARPGVVTQPLPDKSTIPDLEMHDSGSFPDPALLTPRRGAGRLERGGTGISGTSPSTLDNEGGSFNPLPTGAPPTRVLPQMPAQPPKRRPMVTSGRNESGIRELSLPRISKNDDLRLLRRFTRLIDLDLSGSQVSDISELACLRKLERLSLAKTPILEIDGVAELGCLRKLDLSYTSIDDVRALRALPVLEELDLSFSNVRDLSPLSALPRLTRLILRGSPVQDLAPVAELRSLRYLDIKGCPIRTLRVLRPIVNNCRIIVDAAMAERLRRAPKKR